MMSEPAVARGIFCSGLPDKANGESLHDLQYHEEIEAARETSPVVLPIPTPRWKRSQLLASSSRGSVFGLHDVAQDVIDSS